MCDHMELTLCQITQLYVGTHRMRCCASLSLDYLQGFQCLLGQLGLSPLLDPVMLMGCVEILTIDQPDNAI